MGVSWTKEQQQVISLRDRNILVSAAAGSGKTAVLVERIIGLVTDPVHPVDIDQLLIVTFTNAAAAEMRERIGAAIEERVEAEPDNGHLLRQLTLVHHAQITTIHSFCLHVIRNYFHKIDLDPSFRIGDDGELKLLKEEVAEKLLERHYDQPEDGFTEFVDTFAGGKDDGGVGELILRCYEFSRSYPWPLEWLADCRRAYTLSSEVELEQAQWMRFLVGQMELELEELANTAEKMQAVCEEEGGPAYLLPVIVSDVERIREACGFDTFAQGQSRIRSISFDRMPRKKKTDIFEEEKLEQVKAMRDAVKKSVSKLQKNYCTDTLEQILKQLQEAAPAVSVLTGLAEEFSQEYAMAKRSRNLVDFNDLEHFALEILTERKDGQIVRTDAAKQYSETFAEIMIDEYQDSNLVQEVVLNAVSREPYGHPNIFMVGDVKQSIYKFRLARPELFMDKYHSYTTEESLYQKIELHKNFRSRASVLAGVNELFAQIMQESLGGIAYTEETALHPGLEFPETEKQAGGSVELLLLDLEDNRAEEIEQESSADRESEEQEWNSREWEARLVGQRILELTNPEHPQYVWDKTAKAYRPASYRDIVILLRSLSGWSEVFADTLMNMGIPAYAESRNGYFTTIEVQTVLNLLRIIDNPMQDIPLAAVLHSPLVGLSSEELAEIVGLYPKDMGGGLYEALLFFREHLSDSEEKVRESTLNLKQLAGKTAQFLTDLEEYREMASCLPLHILLERILEQTGYLYYVSLMPGGERRKANLDMLLQKALSYESTSYKGVFHFIRYIELLQKYSVDFGEASVTEENEDTVRIMSIHKSKGLEFPIVLLAGCGKKFNTQDSREKVIFHPDYGMGIDAVHPKYRTKTSSLMKRAFGEKLRLENLAEELRVLYVALTRAKEKLILTGTSKNLQEYLQKVSLLSEPGAETVSYGTLTKAAGYLDVLLPALCSRGLLCDGGQETKRNAAVIPDEQGRPLFMVRFMECLELAESRKETAKEEQLQRQEFTEWDDGKVWQPEWAEEIEKRFAYEYHYDRLYQMHTTLSVSELKRMTLEEDTAEQAAQLYERPFEPTVPSFLTDREEQAGGVSGARRGTLYHLVMEYLPYAEQVTEADIRMCTERLVQEGILRNEEKKLIRTEKILGFFRTELYGRLYRAYQRKCLHREQQFLIGIQMAELSAWNTGVFEAGAEAEHLPLVDMSRGGGEFAMVQGVIDLYFEEEDGLVLLDYKTDRVKTEEELAGRYQVQLDYYQLALEKMTGKPVKERYLYSFHFGKLIPLGNISQSFLQKKE